MQFGKLQDNIQIQKKKIVDSSINLAILSISNQSKITLKCLYFIFISSSVIDSY